MSVTKLVRVSVFGNTMRVSSFGANVRTTMILMMALSF